MHRKKHGEVPSLPYIAILNMPAYFCYPKARYMLAAVLVISPSKLTKKSKILDFLVNIEGKMPSTGASIYLDLGCQKHAGMFSMVM